jgi:hypothetical protein
MRARAERTRAIRARIAAADSATRARIVGLAEQELGYREPGNYCTKFGPCEVWCSLFVTWVWRHAGIGVPSLPFTGNLYDWARAETVVRGPNATPEPGDAVLFGSGPANVYTSLHVGIVEAVYPHYLVTIEGDVIHDVHRFVIPASDALLAGEPGPIYAYASPLDRAGGHGYPATPAAVHSTVEWAASIAKATADTIPQALLTNRHLSQNAALAGPRLESTIRALSAFQHMPFHSADLNLNWTGVNRAGKVDVTVRAPLTMPYAELAWQRFLHRFNDSGGAYVASFQTYSGPPVAFSPPSISGRAVAGQTLTAVHGNWANSPTGYRDQWELCNRSGGACSPIAGTTGPTYTLTASDAGHVIRVQEIASNSLGAGRLSTSGQTAVVTKPPRPLRPSSPPVSHKPAAPKRPPRRAASSRRLGGCRSPGCTRSCSRRLRMPSGPSCGMCSSCRRWMPAAAGRSSRFRPRSSPPTPRTVMAAASST